MTQTKRQSILEAVTTVGLGFIVSYLVWLFVVPCLFSIRTRPDRGLAITGLFTVTSLVRCYIVRRLFND
jgi:hypothetical protein